MLPCPLLPFFPRVTSGITPAAAMPEPKRAKRSSGLVQTGCNKLSAMQSTMQWGGFEMQRSSDGRLTSTFEVRPCRTACAPPARSLLLPCMHPADPAPPLRPQVFVNGDVPNLCASGVHIANAAGAAVAQSEDDTCTFVLSSSSCCRHGFADVYPLL